MKTSIPDRETTVLIVDDSPDRRELMCVLLEKAGYRVSQADDGLSGLDAAQRDHPHLVISDVAMPRADGIQLCRWIRGDIELRGVPILLVSGMRVGAESAVRGLEAGADDYLEAPYDPVHLVAKVARLIERARLEEHYRGIVEQASEIIYTHDLQGALTSINTSGARFTGRNTEELLGRHFCESLGVAGGAGRLSALLAELLEKETLSEQVEAVNARGEHRWLDLNLTLISDRGGVGVGVRGVARDITERKNAEDQLMYDACHDSLTGLPNRAFFMDRLGQAVERARRHKGSAFAVLFLDLDRFKVINDSLGHMVGDQLLIEVGAQLTSCLRASDTVARLGGDEFTILMEDIHDVRDAIHLAERIKGKLSVPLKLGEHEAFTTASIGIALSSLGYEHAEDLLRDANIAMHSAKSLGKSCHQVFDGAMHSHAMELLRLETYLRRATNRDDYRIHYQPVVSLEGGEILGFEALVRWQHPDRGLVLPGEFISVAEETGLIVPLDRWVLREACKQARRWQQLRGGADPLSVSVNLSPKQFAHPDLVEYLEQTLAETGLPAECLKLEITEGLLMSEADSVTKMLLQLKELGIELHLDDFGTGYSSLSYLHRYPIDVIKVDKSFIGRIGERGENAEIPHAIITLAHNLGMRALAEGVEQEHQLQHLKAMGCEFAQGYLFSPAVDATLAEKMITGLPQPTQFFKSIPSHFGN